MDPSLIVARILGIVYLAFALGILLDWERYQKIFVELMYNVPYLIMAGFLACVMGVLIISMVPGVSNDWTILISIVGWIAVFKGILLIAYPHKMGIYESFVRARNAKWLVLLISLGLGGMFLYFGYLQ